MPKNLHKTTKQWLINKQRDLALKHDQDIGRKAMLSDVKTAFTGTPTLINHQKGNFLVIFM